MPANPRPSPDGRFGFRRDGGQGVGGLDGYVALPQGPFIVVVGQMHVAGSLQVEWTYRLTDVIAIETAADPDGVVLTLVVPGEGGDTGNGVRRLSVRFPPGSAVERMRDLLERHRAWAAGRLSPEEIAELQPKFIPRETPFAGLEEMHIERPAEPA